MDDCIYSDSTLSDFLLLVRRNFQDISQKGNDLAETVDRLQTLLSKREANLVQFKADILIGRNIKKMLFCGSPSDCYYGTIMSYSSPFFTISYDDGASENMTVEKVLRYLDYDELR
jgi:hypothetical protein